RSLAVIAGENAETAGVDGKGSVQTELRGEIGDMRAGKLRELPRKPVRLRVVAAEMFDRAFVVLKKVPIAGGLLESCRRNLVQQSNGIVLGGSPELGIQSTEEQTRARIPARLKIVGEVVQLRQTIWKLRKVSSHSTAGTFRSCE